jgi:cytochrome c biogenesis protein CcdA
LTGGWTTKTLRPPTRAAALALVLYNIMFVVPLIVVLVLSLDPVLGGKLQEWERSSSRKTRGITGAVMALLGVGLLIWVL